MTVRLLPSRRAWIGLLAAASFLGFAAGAGRFAFDCRRALTLPAADPAPVRERLLACSNIDQTVDAPEASDEPADVRGWSMFVARGDAPATITVVLRKQADRVVFYPRLGGPGASVTVEEPLGKYRRKLFSLAAAGPGWTPIGAQYPLCLSCVENGWSDEPFPVTLLITLAGRGTQLWHRGEAVFFEAP